MANPFPFASGDVLTAAELNSIGEWITYSPSATNWTIGNATVTARYTRVQNFVMVICDITWGSTSTVTGTGMQISLPVTMGTSGRGNAPYGTVWWYDATVGTQVYGLVAGVNTTNAMFNAMSSSGSYVSIAYSSSAVPFTLQSGDNIFMTFIYEGS